MHLCCRQLSQLLVRIEINKIESPFYIHNSYTDCADSRNGILCKNIWSSFDYCVKLKLWLVRKLYMVHVCDNGNFRLWRLLSNKLWRQSYWYGELFLGCFHIVNNGHYPEQLSWLHRWREEILQYPSQNETQRWAQDQYCKCYNEFTKA